MWRKLGTLGLGVDHRSSPGERFLTVSEDSETSVERWSITVFFCSDELYSCFLKPQVAVYHLRSTVPLKLQPRIMVTDQSSGREITNWRNHMKRFYFHLPKTCNVLCMISLLRNNICFVLFVCIFASIMQYVTDNNIIVTMSLNIVWPRFWNICFEFSLDYFY